MSGWKHWVFEGGVRSAAFIRYPPITGGARAGTVHAGLFHSVDWLPTIVAIVGGDTARNLPLDGLDITVSVCFKTLFVPLTFRANPADNLTRRRPGPPS